MMPASEDVEFERFRRMGKAVRALFSAVSETVPENVAADVVKTALQIGFLNDYGGDTYREHVARQAQQFQLQQKQVELQEKLVGIMEEAVGHLRALVASQYEPEESRETTPDQAQL